MLAWIQTIVNEGVATHHQRSTRNRQRMKLHGRSYLKPIYQQTVRAVLLRPK